MKLWSFTHILDLHGNIKTMLHYYYRSWGKSPADYVGLNLVSLLTMGLWLDDLYTCIFTPRGTSWMIVLFILNAFFAFCLFYLMTTLGITFEKIGL